MDPALLPFQIAAGILWAGFIVLLLRLGMNIYRNNSGVRSIFGAAMFTGGLWAVVVVSLAAAGR